MSGVVSEFPMDAQLTLGFCDTCRVFVASLKVACCAPSTLLQEVSDASHGSHRQDSLYGAMYL